jgi:hypothetical protein
MVHLAQVVCHGIVVLSIIVLALLGQLPEETAGWLRGRVPDRVSGLRLGRVARREPVEAARWRAVTGMC